MKKKEAIEKIRKMYLKDYKWKNSVQDRIPFFQDLIKETEKHGLDSYKECSQGYLAWVKEEYDIAQNHFEKSISMDQELAYPWHGLGHVFWKKKDYEKAIQAYEKAIEIDPNFAYAHNDHTSDLESILTLLHNYNKEIKDSSDASKENTIRREIAKEKNIDLKEVSDKEIDERFLGSDRRKVMDFYITLSVFKKYSGLFDLFSKNDYRLHVIEPGKGFDIDHEIKVEVIKARHYDIISDRDSVGFVISHNDTSIIYTGDTGWNVEIEEQYKKVAENHKSSHKLLIAHLGGFKERERTYPSRQDKEKAFYDYHLGRLGLVKINEVLKPHICFISEFGEELKGYRRKIAKIFNEAFKGKITFLPADIGLKYDLLSKKIAAITKVDAADKKMDFGYVEPEKVKATTLIKDFSLHYFQTDAGIEESELVQVLQHQFEESMK
jgi:tetratricopeptide (TPR) repeat protein